MMPDHPEQGVQELAWQKCVVRAGSVVQEGEEIDSGSIGRQVEPWLAALLQAEHLALLAGSGLTAGIAQTASSPNASMGRITFDHDLGAQVDAAADESAARTGRGEANVEDQIRVARQLIEGLRVLAHDPIDSSEPTSLQGQAAESLVAWSTILRDVLGTLRDSVLSTERGIRETATNSDDVAAVAKANTVRRLLGSFLLTFASRAASRERLNIFTTNYDRLIEFGCDLVGLRVLDRFVGTLEPALGSSRLGVDFHYNPPGIRGEPHYLEGVVRLTKLHGSIDWAQVVAPSGQREVVRRGIPFGAGADYQGVTATPQDSLIIYPNPAKDMETLEFPYADLFRDFAAATCQPNSVLVCYGYGFGDDHINRIIREALSIPSAHLVVMSFDHAGGRIQRFCETVGRDEQITLLIGAGVADLPSLVRYYLPKPAIDRTTWRMVELLNRRLVHNQPHGQTAADEADGAEGP